MLHQRDGTAYHVRWRSQCSTGRKAVQHPEPLLFDGLFCTYLGNLLFQAACEPRTCPMIEVVKSIICPQEQHR
jgi:hypothetical protein